MDMLKTVRETGLFETGRNLEAVINSKDIQEKAGGVMPLPTPDFSQKLPVIAEWLTSFRKTKYMFLTPEIALVDELAEKNPHGEAIFLVPSDMDPEVKERLTGNLPRTMPVSLVEEPYFPEVYPGNSILVVCGYLAGDRMMVLSDTYRMIEHYRHNFYGKMVFIPYVELETSVRYDGWMEVGNEKINQIWRNEE